jgi:hypothetical protein
MSAPPVSAATAPPVSAATRLAGIAAWGVVGSAVLDGGLTLIRALGPLVAGHNDSYAQAGVLTATLLAGALLVFPGLIVGIGTLRAVRGHPLARAVAWVTVPVAFLADVVGMGTTLGVLRQHRQPPLVLIVIAAVMLGILACLVVTVVAVTALAWPTCRDDVRAATERRRGGPASERKGRTVLRIVGGLLWLAVVLQLAAVGLLVVVSDKVGHADEYLVRNDRSLMVAGSIVAGLAVLPLILTHVGALLAGRLRRWWVRTVAFCFGVAMFGLAVPGLVFLVVPGIELADENWPVPDGAVSLAFTAFGLVAASFLLFGAALVLLALPSVSAYLADEES